MTQLRHHERLAIEMLLAGEHPILAKLRKQALQVSVSKRTYTTAGEYVDFAVPDEVELVEPSDLILQDVAFEFKDVKDGAAILLHVEHGRISFLEFATYGIEWPEEPGVLGAHYLRGHQTQPGTYSFERVTLRDQATLERALLRPVRRSAA